MKLKFIFTAIFSILMGLMCCELMFGVLAIWIMSYSRESSNKEVAESIVNQWGKSVYIQGPTAKENLDSVEWVRPLKFDCQAEVETKSLHRSIYEAEVFTANVSMSGLFDRDSLLALGDSVVQLTPSFSEVCYYSYLWQQ